MTSGEPEHNGGLFRSLAENNPGIVFQMIFHRETGFRLVYICERVQTLPGFTAEQLREDPSRLIDRVSRADFLMKPVDRRKMAETIRRVLNARHL